MVILLAHHNFHSPLTMLSLETELIVLPFAFLFDLTTLGQLSILPSFSLILFYHSLEILCILLFCLLNICFYFVCIDNHNGHYCNKIFIFTCRGSIIINYSGCNVNSVTICSIAYGRESYRNLCYCFWGKWKQCRKISLIRFLTLLLCIKCILFAQNHINKLMLMTINILPIVSSWTQTRLIFFAWNCLL